MSHTNCNHENTKSARAKCRRLAEKTVVVEATDALTLQLSQYAESVLGWDIAKLQMSDDDADELREVIESDFTLSDENRESLLAELLTY